MHYQHLLLFLTCCGSTIGGRHVNRVVVLTLIALAFQLQTVTAQSTTVTPAVSPAVSPTTFSTTIAISSSSVASSTTGSSSTPTTSTVQTTTASNLPLILGLSLGIGIPVLIGLIILAVCGVRKWRERRSLHGVYNPSKQETVGGIDQLQSDAQLSAILKVPPEERLI